MDESDVPKEKGKGKGKNKKKKVSEDEEEDNEEGASKKKPNKKRKRSSLDGDQGIFSETICYYLLLLIINRFLITSHSMYVM